MSLRTLMTYSVSFKWLRYITHNLIKEYVPYDFVKEYVPYIFVKEYVPHNFVKEYNGLGKNDGRKVIV